MGLLRVLVGTGGATLAVLVLASLLNSVHPAFDTVAHFRAHLAAFLLLAVLASWFVAIRSWAVLFGGVAAVGFVSIFPHWPGLTAQEKNYPASDIVRIAQMNLRFDNQDTNGLVEALKAKPADILLLQEVTETTGPVLEAFLASHPHQLDCRFEAIGSVAILSRFPFASARMQICQRAFGFAAAEVSVDGRVLTVASFHSYWPWPFRQTSQIEALIPVLASLKTPAVIAGDFNATPWSAAVAKMASASATRPAPGYFPSWRLGFFRDFWPFSAGLPIDNLLFSNGLSVIERKLGPDGGSDHLPVFTSLRFTDDQTNRSAK